MKKFCVFLSIFLLLIPLFTYAEAVEAPPTEEEENQTETTEDNQNNSSSNNSTSDLIAGAKAGILMEASTGQILFEKNKDEQLAVASMTKMVAQILILEAIEDGKISWDDPVKASENAASMGGSQIYLAAGETLTVEEMMKGISMASANDATVAMAEFLAGTEVEFVKQMNEKVQELGLKNTVFKNSTGLDEDGHYSSAYDMAIIAQELLKHEKILEFSSLYEDYLRTDTENKFWLVNTNKLVRFYEGADGLKTGHTDAAAYCLAATAKRNDMRLIAIVLGENDSTTRNSETMELLDYGFNTYQIQIVKQKGDIVKTMPLEKATEQEIALTPISDIGILSQKGIQTKEYTYDIQLNKIKLPIKQGDTVGKLIVKDGDTVITEGDLTVTKEVKPLSLLNLFAATLKDIIAGNCQFQ